MSERRRWTRIMMRLKGRPEFLCTVLVDHGSGIRCTLEDVSCGGLRLRLAEGQEPPQLMEGQGLELDEFSAPRLEFLQGRRGIVSWYRPGEREFGMSFHEILRKGQVESLLD